MSTEPDTLNNAHQVRCPYCQAEPGVLCTTWKGTPAAETHKAREHFLRDLRDVPVPTPPEVVLTKPQLDEVDKELLRRRNLGPLRKDDKRLKQMRKGKMPPKRRYVVRWRDAVWCEIHGEIHGTYVESGICGREDWHRVYVESSDRNVIK